MKLTVGAYRNEAGKPWVLPVVKKVRSANLVAISTSFGEGGVLYFFSFIFPNCMYYKEMRGGGEPGDDKIT